LEGKWKDQERVPECFNLLLGCLILNCIFVWQALIASACVCVRVRESGAKGARYLLIREERERERESGQRQRSKTAEILKQKLANYNY